MTTDPTTAPRGALIALGLSILLASLGTSIANVALPSLTQAFTASFQAVQWVVLAYLIAITTLVVGVGRLGDLIGRRRLFLAGLAIFVAGSALSGLAPGLMFLVAARLIQGVGAAVMMALSLAFVAQTVPPARTGSAMGLLGTLSAVGTALGPSLGGVLIATAGWRAIFLILAPLGVVALVLAWQCLPDDRPSANSRRPFDVAGMAVLGLTLAAYALAMTLGRGHWSLVNGVLLGITVAGIAAFAVIEARTASPLVEPVLLRDPGLSAGLVGNALVATVMMSTLVVGPFYLAYALGLDAAWVGLVMSAGPVMSALAGVPAGRLVDRFGARVMTLAGLTMTGIGCCLLALLPLSWGVVAYVMPILLTTAGYALFQASNTTAVMKDAPADRRGVVSGLLNLARNLGLVTGASVMGAVFAFASGASAMTMVSPAAVATGMRISFAVAAGLILLAFLFAWPRHGSTTTPGFEPGL